MCFCHVFFCNVGQSPHQFISETNIRNDNPNKKYLEGGCSVERMYFDYLEKMSQLLWRGTAKF